MRLFAYNGGGETFTLFVIALTVRPSAVRCYRGSCAAYLAKIEQKKTEAAGASLGSALRQNFRRKLLLAFSYIKLRCINIANAATWRKAA